MVRINLLPWRESLRKEQQKKFISISAFTAAFFVVLAGFVHIQINGAIDYQHRRNRFLENEIKILDDKIKEIKKLESTKKALIERMNIIKDLQSTRPSVVHLFDELVITLPEKLFLTSVKQGGKSLNISGKAASNSVVSAYMDNIDGSEWLTSPTLVVIETKYTDQGRISSFNLKAHQSAPKDKSKESAK